MLFSIPLNRPLDPKSDTLQVALSLLIYQFTANSIGTKCNPNWRYVLEINSVSCVVSEKICRQTLQTRTVTLMIENANKIKNIIYYIIINVSYQFE